MYQETFYAVYDDGSTGVLTVESQDGSSHLQVELPRPGRLVDVEEYDRARAALTAQREAYIEQLMAADRIRTRNDYEALVSFGIPDDTARRLTGWSAEMEARA